MRFLLALAAILAALATVPGVRADDGRLRIEVELANRGSATRWRVVIVRERRLLWQGSVRTARRSTARVRRSAADWFGSDAVAVRAVSRRGEACRATAMLP